VRVKRSLLAVQALAKSARVVGRVGFPVVVEVDVDVAAAGAPGVDPARPVVELAVLVAAPVEFVRALQTT
jgi:hypothetical protein